MNMKFDKKFWLGELKTGVSLLLIGFLLACGMSLGDRFMNNDSLVLEIECATEEEYYFEKPKG